jgi:UDP-GlcNAc:undecaprenyl-phosphate/decaprenyl-phosphate GlcNAc-1-phosphate transferase
MLTTSALAFLAAALLSVVLTGVVRRIAIARAWLDRPTEARKVHVCPTPRIGGLAIAIAFFVPVVGVLAWQRGWSSSEPQQLDQLVGLLGGAAFLTLVGLVDDLQGLSPWSKLAAQVGAAAFAQWHGLEIQSISNPFGAPLELHWLAVPVTTLWIVGITNAINLIDGLDGLAAGTGLFAVVTLFVIAAVGGNGLVALLAAALAGALLGFLRHNFNPASIFMGDSGSLFLGYALATTAIWGSTKGSMVVSLLIPLLCLGLPIADATLAVVRRFIRGVPIFSADREHIHHRLLARGLSHRESVLTLYAGAALLALAALGLELGDHAYGPTLLVAVGVVALVAAKLLGLTSWRRLVRAVRYGRLRRHATLERMRRLAQCGERLRKASSMRELSHGLRDVSMALDVAGMCCRFEVGHRSSAEPARTHEWTWHAPERGEAPDDDGRVDLSFSLDVRDPELSLTGTLAFWWRCPSPVLQIPEQPLYEWLALLVRERMLALLRHEHGLDASLRAA